MRERDEAPKGHDEEVEAALLDVELFLKYGAPARAVERLRVAVGEHPRSIVLRERLREVGAANHQATEAARQCLALASLYLAREDFDAAQERLLAAKQLDPRISIATGLEAVRRARRPAFHARQEEQAAAVPNRRRFALAGDLSVVSLFDAVQVLENSRLTGALTIYEEGPPPAARGRVLFNEGRIVGAECGPDGEGHEAFRAVVEFTSGVFEFQKSEREFPVTINALSNTNLILDALRQLDEENREEE